MDKIANLCSILRSGSLYKSQIVTVRYSRFVIEILRLLWILGFINGFSIISSYNAFVYLKYYKNYKALNNIKLSSRQGKRIFIRLKHINKINIQGTLIITTNKGLFTHYDCVKYHVSGEFILFVQ